MLVSSVPPLLPLSVVVVDSEVVVVAVLVVGRGVHEVVGGWKGQRKGGPYGEGEGRGCSKWCLISSASR